MKQYTTPEQTAKLRELGFEKPRCLHNCELAYNVGELIEMLPQSFTTKDKSEATLSMHTGGLGTWQIQYLGFEYLRQSIQWELIDALYDMVIKLKEEGVI